MRWTEGGHGGLNGPGTVEMKGVSGGGHWGVETNLFLAGETVALDLAGSGQE